MTEEKKNVTDEVAKKEGKQVDVSSVGDKASSSDASDSGTISLLMEDMLKAGMHFGHKKSRWNPKMKKYIFGVRNGIHIIDLEKSILEFRKTINFLDGLAKKGGKVLFVGTKSQAKALVKEVADNLEMPYVNNRWLGGTFTNFNVIRKRVKFLQTNRESLEKGRLVVATKLEMGRLTKKLDKIEERMGGLERMDRLPDAVFVLDVNESADVIREAKKVGIKTVGLVDTNCDPDAVDYLIPGNDDAVSSIKYVLKKVQSVFKK